MRNLFIWFDTGVVIARSACDLSIATSSVSRDSTGACGTDKLDVVGVTAHGFVAAVATMQGLASTIVSALVAAVVVASVYGLSTAFLSANSVKLTIASKYDVYLLAFVVTSAHGFLVAVVDVHSLAVAIVGVNAVDIVFTSAHCLTVGSVCRIRPNNNLDSFVCQYNNLAWNTSSV